jgi:lipoate-protein ligase A
LHHGTLILSLDQRMMDGVLRPVKERKYPGLTSIEEILGKVPERKKIIEAFEKGFEDLR